jgi:signal transduction histidine kinase
MARRRLRLHHRIVIPFALIALIATSLTAYVALTVASRALETRVETQILNAAALISQSDFALNPAILRSVKAIAGADVITFDDSGTVLASTLDAARSRVVVAALGEAGAGGGSLSQADGVPVVRQIDCGEPCEVAYRRVPSRPGTAVAVVAARTELLAATRTVTQTILIAAFLSLVGMIIVSQAVARRVTAPLDVLVGFTKGVDAGDAGLRTPAGDDEVGALGQAFNDMLDRLDQSRDALVRSEKLALAGLFAARVAHDIRNPLAAIKMQTQLLRARLGSGSDRQSVAMLDSVHRDIVQVESVVRDLLELARPGELKREMVRLGDVVDDTLEHVAPHLTYRKIHIQKSIGSSLPPISLDAARFKQALLNVISNAAEAMPEGGTLTVAAALSNAGSEVRLDVCDDGAGIDMAILPRVFDPFVSTKRDGMGLGLVNTKSVVDNHGGRIEIGPLGSRGTRVSIWLPTGSVQHG